MASVAPSAEDPDRTVVLDTDRRLMITKIVNENFKSYAGKQELGPFHKRFSSIVGPNGSGKSNVIDALLFVFGYRASKIRSQKVSSLIHNSDKHTNLQSCTVSVHFQQIIDAPGDDYEVVPDSHLVVSRTAYRDNSSSYYVNGRKTSFKDVTALLRNVGIDLDHNRFLILQGEVEQIAMMKPKAPNEHEDGMLEYLEDIIGSSQFKEPIEELAKKVEELNEARGEKLNRVKAVEKEKDGLEGPKNEAVSFLRTENEMTCMMHRLFQHHLFECRAQEQKARTKYEESSSKFKDVDGKLEEISGTMKVQQKALRKEESKLEKIQASAETAQKEFADFEQRDVRLQEDLKLTQEKPKKLEKAIQKEKKKVEELTAAPGKAEKELETLHARKGELEAQKGKEEAKLEEVMAGLRSATEGLQAEKEVKEAELGEARKSVNDAKRKMDIAKSELQIYEDRLNSHSKLLKKAQDGMSSAKETAEAKMVEVSRLEKELPAAKKELSSREEELVSVRNEEQTTSEKLRNIRINFESARQNMEASSNRGKLMDQLMSEMKSGRLPGIHGRLGDLGAIDDKYDVAISTACGPLDNIVVENMDVAQQCVTFLRKQSLGTATFIGMDQMQRWAKNAAAKVATPENVPRLFDLVRPKDPRFASVFYFALRDTLVASNMDQAMRVAFNGSKRWRVVTLDGKLIDTSGTMSGGGNRVARGRMAAHIPVETSPAELKAMQTELAQLEKRAPELQHRRQELESKVKTLTKTVKDMSFQLEVARQDVQAARKHQSELEQQIAKLEQQAETARPEEDKEHVKKLQAVVATAEKEWKKVNDVSSKIEAEVQRIHQKIVDITGGKMKAQQDRVDAVSSDLDKVTSSITKTKVSIKSAQRNLVAAQKKAAALEEELADNTNEIQRIQDEISKLEDSAEDVLDKLKCAKEADAEQQNVVAKLAAQLAEEDKSLVSLRSQYLDAKHDREKYESALKDNVQKVKHWQKELGRLSLHDLTGLLPEEEKQDEAEGENPRQKSTPDEFHDVTEEEMQTTDWDQLNYQITLLEEQLAQRRPNMAAIENFKEKERAYLERIKELDGITAQRDGQRRQYDQLRKERLDTFMSGFSVITTKLKEMYQMITLGGDAELELVDSLDPFTEGIVFSVRPPKKSWKNISNLSGGEKTLSSLALVFALHHFKPTPLYVMDEIDAALDFKNVSIVAHYIKERTKNAQFIIISLRNNMFELADRLVGIYKTHNCTKSVTIDPSIICEA